MVNRKTVCKQALRRIVASVSLVMEKAANGTASTNFSYQPKKPNKKY